MNLLDDSLSADLSRSGGLDRRMTARFLALGHYAASTGADAILFTCSAFGPCIEAVTRDLAPMPVLKPNEAMIEEAVALGRRIGLLASFPLTLATMPPEFPAGVEVVPQLAEGALAALDRGGGGGEACGMRCHRAGAIQSGAGSADGCRGDRPPRAHHARERGGQAPAAPRRRLGFVRK